MSLISIVKQTIQQNHLVHTGDHVLVGVSGGPDSLALLTILNQLRHEYGIKISVAHVNHQLRKSATADQKHVEKYCRRYHVPFHPIDVDLKKSTKKGSLEEAARRARFKALIQLAKRKKLNSIALGHTQDDQAETILMRIIRGAGLKGLQSILPKRSIDRFTIIRPLIACERKHVERFLKQKKIKYHLDPTNRQKKYFRNKIRLDLLPLLEKQYNPNIKQLLANLAQSSALDYDFLKQQADRKLSSLTGPSQKAHTTIKIPLSSFKKMHGGMQHMIIFSALEQILGQTRRFTLEHIHNIVQLADGPSSKRLSNLPQRISVKKSGRSLIISKG